MNLKKISTIFTVSALISISSSPILATDPTMADTPVASNSDTVKKELQDRIKSVVEEQFKTSEEKLSNQTAEGSENRSYGVVGFVNEIKGEIIEISEKNSNYQIKTNSATVIVKAGKNIKISDISIQDRLIAMGKMEGRDILAAKRIVIVAVSEYQKTPVYLKVTKIDTAKKTITALNLNDNSTSEFTLGKKIKFGLADIGEGQTILGVFLTGGSYKTPVLVQGKLQ